jgi:hypothetical protein
MTGSASMPRVTSRMLAVALAIVLGGCEAFCPAPPPPPQEVPTLKAPDGKSYVLLARGSYKPLYDGAGRLERVEYDRNGDGKPDQVARHNGQRLPEVVENDDDFDGVSDRWLYYNASGALVRVGSSRSGKRPDLFVNVAADGKATTQDYDDDGDGRIDRSETLKGGLIDTVAVDANRDGKPDRWQHWAGGLMQHEEIDTDGDGTPDRRLRYGRKGEVVAIEPVRK